MNLYSIKPHDGEELYYSVGNSYGQAVRKYKTRRKADASKEHIWKDWKSVPEPAKVVLVCMANRLITGKYGNEQ
jgi:hypothetical protein